jgi:hypothetical protein
MSPRQSVGGDLLRLALFAGEFLAELCFVLR